MTSIKFAIFTDTHLGYMNEDEIGEDSYNAFRECMETSVNEHCDVILHAGDMFDDGKVKRNALIETINILRQYLFTDPNPDLDDNPIQYLNIQDNGLTNKVPTALDEDVNIKIPFFVIHGNHDQPSGYGHTSNCDILSSARLVNYFAKVIEPGTIELKPIIMRRDDVTVAVYGLGFISENKFVSLLKSRSIIFQDPPDENSQPRRYNILLIHQNRIKKDQSLNLSELLISLCPWMDLFVWGHEHENTLEKELIRNTSKKLKIAQPGSTIVTQLHQDEATPRGMLILEVFSDREVFTPIRLNTQRSFIISQMNLGQEYIAHKPEDVLNEIREKLEAMIDQRDQRDQKPLIKLTISSYIDMRNIPYNLITNEFSQRVANPNNFLILNRKNPNLKKKMNQAITSDIKMTGSSTRIEELVEEKFKEAPLEFLQIDTISKSLESFINHDDKTAFDRNINSLFKMRIDYLVDQIPEEQCEMTTDDALKFIQDKKNELPIMNPIFSGSVSNSSPIGNRKSQFDSQIGDQNRSQNRKGAQNTEQVPTRTTRSVDEEPDIGVEADFEPRKRIPRKPRKPPSLKDLRNVDNS